MSHPIFEPINEAELEQARMHLPAPRRGAAYRYPLDAHRNAGEPDDVVITREAVFVCKHFEEGELSWVLLNPLRLF